MGVSLVLVSLLWAVGPFLTGAHASAANMGDAMYNAGQDVDSSLSTTRASGCQIRKDLLGKALCSGDKRSVIKCNKGGWSAQPPCRNNGKCLDTSKHAEDGKQYILDAKCWSAPAPPPGGWKCNPNKQASLCSKDRTYNFICNSMDEPANPQWEYLMPCDPPCKPGKATYDGITRTTGICDLPRDWFSA